MTRRTCVVFGCAIATAAGAMLFGGCPSIKDGGSSPRGGNGPNPPIEVDGAPRLVGAVSTSNNTVRVSFNESMKDELALDVSNFSIAQANVNPEAGTLRIMEASISADWTTVDLKTESQSEVTYELIVVKLQDITGNVIAPPEALNNTVRTQFFGTPPDGGGPDSDCDGLSDAAEQNGWIVRVEGTDGTVTERGVTSDPFGGGCWAPHPERQSFPAGSEPWQPLFDGEDIWVTNGHPFQAPGTGPYYLYRLNKEGGVVSRVQTPEPTLELAFDGENIWATSAAQNNLYVYRINTSDLALTSFRLPASVSVAYGAAYDAAHGRIWFSSPGTGNLAVFNRDGTSFGNIGPFQWPTRMHYDGEYMWVVELVGKKLKKVRTTDGQQVGTVDFSAGPNAIQDVTSDETRILVLSRNSDTGQGTAYFVRKVDLAIIGQFSTGNDPKRLLSFAGNIWVSHDDGSVRAYGLDGTPRTMGAVSGNCPVGLAAEGSHLWVANNCDGTVSRLLLPSGDTDGDGLDDATERRLGTDPRSPDTDKDGLSDADEWNIWFSSPTDQDSDDDGIDDNGETMTWKTSPIMSDTDGDGLDDGAELFELGRNPRMADVPQFRLNVGTLGLEINRKFTYTDAQGQTQNRTVEAGETLQQSEDSRRARQSSESAETQIGFTESTSVEVAAKFPPGVTFKAGFEARQQFANGHSTSFTEESGRAMSQEYARKRSEAQEIRQENTVTEETVEAKTTGSVTLENTGDISFSVTNLELSVLITDDGDRSRFVPIASMLPESQIVSGNAPQYNLGPLAASKGPIVFKNNQVYPVEVERMMANPRGALVKVVNFDITDEFGRNFAFASQDINDRTAAITIDYGDGTSETYRVATASRFKPDGSPAGLPLTTALEDVIGLTRVKNENTQFTEAQLTDTTFNPPGYKLDETYGTMPQYDSNGLPTGRNIITRIKRRQTSLTNPPPVPFQGRFWAVMVTSDSQPFGPVIGVDETVLQPRESYLVTFTKDEDGDGIFAAEEAMYGSSDQLTDTDADTLSDWFEIRQGWIVPGVVNDKHVYPSPTRADGDFDLLDDTFEMMVKTDPRLADTDDDLLTDADEIFCNTPVLRNDLNADFSVKTSADITRISQHSITQIPATSASYGLKYGGGHIWAASVTNNQVYKLRSTGEVVATFSNVGSAGMAPVDVAHDGSYVWVLVAGNNNGSLLKLDPRNGALLQTVALPDGSRPRWCIYAAGRIWVAPGDVQAIYKVNPANAAGYDTISLPEPGGAIQMLGFDGADLWVTRVNAYVTRLGTDGVVRESRQVGGLPNGVAVGGGYVWVANYQDNTISRLSLMDPAGSATFPTGANPFRVSFMNGDLWVTNSGGVSRHGVNGALKETIVVASPLEVLGSGGVVWVGGTENMTRIGVDQGKMAIAGIGAHEYEMYDFRWGSTLFNRTVCSYSAGHLEPIMMIDGDGPPLPPMPPILGDDVNATIGTDFPPLYPPLRWETRDSQAGSTYNKQVMVLPGPNGIIDTAQYANELWARSGNSPNWWEKTAHTAHNYPYWTDPTNPDTDGDGISDGLERFGGAIFAGDPNDNRDAVGRADADFDGLTDSQEGTGWRYLVNGVLSEQVVRPNPNNPDTDGDGLPDVIEQAWQSNPRNPDTDGDGISDYEEFDRNNTWGSTEPRFIAAIAAIARYDAARDLASPPRSHFSNHATPSGSDPTHRDADGDGLFDVRAQGAIPTTGGPYEGWMVDVDNGLDNGGQDSQPAPAAVRSNPWRQNSDTDGWTDPQERTNGTNPVADDTDGDGTRDDLDNSVLTFGRQRSPLRPDQLVSVEYRIRNNGLCDDDGTGEFGWLCAFQVNGQNWFEAGCGGGQFTTDGFIYPGGGRLYFVHWYLDPDAPSRGAVFHAWFTEADGGDPIPSCGNWGPPDVGGNQLPMASFVTRPSNSPFQNRQTLTPVWTGNPFSPSNALEATNGFYEFLNHAGSFGEPCNIYIGVELRINQYP